MDLATDRPMTLEAFLAWEEQQEERYEFDGERPVLMTGGTKRHNIICTNLLLLLGPQLRGSAWRPYLADIKVTPVNRSRYPDVVVGDRSVTGSETIEASPAVIFEVLSPSTSRTDLVLKIAEYRTIPSLRCYVVLAQDGVAVTVHRRAKAGWIEERLADRDAVLELAEIGVRLPLGEIYSEL